MVKKCYVFSRIFCLFIAFTVLHCASSSAASSSVPSIITVPKNFLAHSAMAMSHFRKEARATLPPNIIAILSRLSSANILIAEESTDCAMYISGKSPIMSTAEKEIMQKVLRSPVFDIFDVILPPEQSVFVRNSLLAYAICCSLVSYTNNLSDLGKPFQKGLIVSIDTVYNNLHQCCRTTPQLAKFVEISELFSREISSSKETIDRLFIEIQTAKEREAVAKEQRGTTLAAIQQARRALQSIEGKLTTDFQRADEALTQTSSEVQSVKMELDKIRGEIHEKIDKPLKEIFSELSKITYEANRLYIVSMENYYKRLGEISPEAFASALFGLNVLGRADPDTQIAYIVAPNKTTEQRLRELAAGDTSPVTTADPFVQQWKLAAKSEDLFWKIQPMYGVVKMSHSEPMYMFKSLLNHEVRRPFFFTQRDMCETCRLAIYLYGERSIKSPLIAISEQACTGQTGSLSKVDYIYAGGTFTKEETDDETVIPNVCQIRIPTLSESTTKNISTRFYSPKKFNVEATD